MAQNPALATAVEPVTGVSELLENLGLTDAPAPAAVTPAADPKTTQPKPEDAKSIRVGDEDFTPEQIASAIQAQKTLDSSREALQMGEMFLMIPDEQRSILMDAIEQISEGKNPLAPASTNPALAANTLVIPKDAEAPPVPKWDELGDEDRYLYIAMVVARQEIDARLKELGQIVNGMRQYLGKVHTQSQDETMAKALRLKGYANATPELIQEMRTNGFSDPIKALEFLKLSGKGKAAPAAGTSSVATAPPEAPAPGDGKVFDANDPNLSIGEIVALVRSGAKPKDPKDEKRLAELIAQHG